MVPSATPSINASTSSRAPKRRIHFVVGIERTDEFVSQRDMMRAKFAGHRDTASSGVPEQPDAAARTEMLAMDPGVAEFGQENISHDHYFLSRSRPAVQAKHAAPIPLVHDTASHHVVVLAMVHDGKIEHSRVLDRPAHHFMVLDAVTIVCDCDDAGLDHRSDRCHLFTVQPFGDCTGREYVNPSAFARSIRDPCDRAWIIRRRIGVWHADNRGKTAGRCRLTSGLDRFLMGLPRLTQVNVDIDQARAPRRDCARRSLHNHCLGGSADIRPPIT